MLKSSHILLFIINIFYYQFKLLTFLPSSKLRTNCKYYLSILIAHHHFVLIDRNVYLYNILFLCLLQTFHLLFQFAFQKTWLAVPSSGAQELKSLSIFSVCCLGTVMGKYIWQGDIACKACVWQSVSMSTLNWRQRQCVIICKSKVVWRHKSYT